MTGETDNHPMHVSSFTELSSGGDFNPFLCFPDQHWQQCWLPHHGVETPQKVFVCPSVKGLRYWLTLDWEGMNTTSLRQYKST